MESLFARLAAKYPSAAQCAAALGLTRQAYCQAEKRRHLSERKAILAGNLLGISPSEALLINHAATNNAALPELNPTPDAINKTYENRPNNTNYANPDGTKKGRTTGDNRLHAHFITSNRQREAVDLIRWVFAVAGIPADSPRFCYYVSRWRIPEKIACAKNNGTFNDSISNCPPIDSAWVRFVPAALEAYADFIKPKTQNHNEALQSSGIKPRKSNTRPLAA